VRNATFCIERMSHGGLLAEFSMRHAGINRKSANDSPWETLNRSKFCLHLTQFRTPARHLHTTDTDLNTCKAPAYYWHWSGYLQGTCQPLIQVRIPAGHLPTPDTGQDTRGNETRLTKTLTAERFPARGTAAAAVTADRSRRHQVISGVTITTGEIAISITISTTPTIPRSVLPKLAVCTDTYNTITQISMTPSIHPVVIKYKIWVGRL